MRATPPVLTLTTVSREHRTPGQVRRRERDLGIALAWAGGASVRVIARQYRLAPSRVCQILADLRSEYAVIERRQNSGAVLPKPLRRYRPSEN